MIDDLPLYLYIRRGSSRNIYHVLKILSILGRPKVVYIYINNCLPSDERMQQLTRNNDNISSHQIPCHPALSLISSSILSKMESPTHRDVRLIFVTVGQENASLEFHLAYRLILPNQNRTESQ